MPKVTRPPKSNKQPLPPTRPSKQADVNNAMWEAIKSLQEQVDRLTKIDDDKVVAAAELREKLLGKKGV